MPLPNADALLIKTIQGTLDIEVRLLTALNDYLDQRLAPAEMERYKIAPLYAHIARSVFERNRKIVQMQTKQDAGSVSLADNSITGPIVAPGLSGDKNQNRNSYPRKAATLREGGHNAGNSR